MKHIIKLFLIGIILILQSCKMETGKTIKTGLKLPERGTAFELVQRASTSFPGYSEDLIIGIGDITKGRTILSLLFGKKLILQKPIVEGQEIPFEIEGEKYVFVCEWYKNKLIGNDKGYFKILHAHSKEKKMPLLTKDQANIERLLQVIEHSDVTFIRNVEEHLPKEAADHLRSKYEKVKDKITTYNLFISKIISASSVTGETYIIRLKSGEMMKAADWYKIQNVDFNIYYDYKMEHLFWNNCFLF